MFDDRRLSVDFEMCDRPRRRSCTLEDLEREGRCFEHGFGGHLDAVSDPGAIIERDRARADAHRRDRTIIRLFFALMECLGYAETVAAFLALKANSGSRK